MNKSKLMDIDNEEFSEYDVPVDEKSKDGKKRKLPLFEKLLLVNSFIGALFFALNIYLSISKLKDSNFFPFIMGFGIAYIIVYFIFLFVHRNSYKEINRGKKNFKDGYKFIKLIMNLLFIASSALILIESIQSIDQVGTYAKINIGISAILLFTKLISTLRKIRNAIHKKGI